MPCSRHNAMHLAVTCTAVCASPELEEAVTTVLLLVAHAGAACCSPWGGTTTQRCAATCARGVIAAGRPWPPAAGALERSIILFTGWQKGKRA